jgi:glutamate synthase domain-containing protein 2
MSIMNTLISYSRFAPFALILSGWLVATVNLPSTSMWVWVPLTVLSALGIWDLVQTRRGLMRNYPLTGHIRVLSETFGPQIRQYFVENDTEGKPFDREQRSLVYQRAKNVSDTMPFGTERLVNASGFEWANHSMAPKPVPHERTRIVIGGDQCTQPYDSSLLNISAMSFGSLSGRAIEALNRGARIGGFAHDTGEGGLSHYHLRHAGDLIWEIGTGYFGCRTQDGQFDRGAFAEKAAITQVKMIQIKLSQGAKPGHGGILPGAKVSAEIAAARDVPIGQDCISPPYHQEFDSPCGLLEFAARLRDASGGKPTGFKLCIGHPWEFLGLCKAMVKTNIVPDFIVIDGKEGGTGAAPVEFCDHVGTPLREGLVFAHNALIGAGLRERIKIGASGKVVSGFDMALTLALGADWCNAARAFMLALGCLQSQKCHTNRCPVGIATQDPIRERALIVADKSERVVNFHTQTTHALEQIAAAIGVSSPTQLILPHFYHRISPHEVRSFAQLYAAVPNGAFLDTQFTDPFWQPLWDRACADAF